MTKLSCQLLASPALLLSVFLVHTWVKTDAQPTTSSSAQLNQKQVNNTDLLLPDVADVSQEQLNEQSLLGINWMQESGEYRALAYQAFNTARMAFDLAVVKGITNPAVIVDIDETVLDNSPYQASMINTNEGFNPHSWNAWIMAKQATAVPGAVAFVNYVNANGGRVFFISDRSESSSKNSENNDLELATIANLEAVGFTGVTEETVLLKGEFTKLINGKEDTSKEFRRNAVDNGSADGQTYTTVVLVGDNLNDFEEAGETNSARRSYVTTNQARYGSLNTVQETIEPAYILLPNPLYGAWESRLYNPAQFGHDRWYLLTPGQKDSQRRNALNRWNPQTATDTDLH